MITNIFKKKSENVKDEKRLVLICALFIHAAKMDENYTDKEKSIILKALSDISDNKEINLKFILEEAEKKENQSNQILEFTREVKNKSFEEKKIVIEALWNIIYSDEQADMYETNLMRRLSGLLYLDPKIVGDIKEKVRSKQ